MDWSRPAILIVAALVLASSLTAPVAAAHEPAVAPVTADQHEPPPDPDTDVIGWEAGVWHNESIDVDQSDGLSETERELFVARAMARVEVIRDREFKEPVNVSVISREEQRNRSQRSNQTEAFSEWNNQVWEGLFVVDEDTNVTEELQALYGENVLGYYSPATDELVIVSDDTSDAVIDNATLIHELVHALQDQYYNLSSERYAGETQDGDLAIDGLIEGEANYIERKYTERCGVNWTCVETPQSGFGGGGGGQVNLGILVTVLNPYSDGPVYIDSLVETGGWDAVDAAFEDPPQASEQIIHRDKRNDTPVPIEYEHTAENGWEPFPEQGVNGYDTVGEASMYAMFWYQDRNYGIDVISTSSFFQPENQYDLYNYEADPTRGWGNDRLYPYERDDEFGYVWVTEWDTAVDAEEFEAAYVEMLTGHGATKVAEDRYVIEDGGFADAFLVVRDGSQITIVNGPTMDDVDDLRPSLATTPTSTPPSPTPPSPTVTSTAVTTTVAETPPPTTVTPTPQPTPGFGFLTAVAALIVALWVRRR